MLTVYRRHKKDCKQAVARDSKKCRCALWADGTLEGKPYRKSLKTRSWERAEQIKREIENGTRPDEKLKPVTVKDALESFIRECETRNLKPNTIAKYRRLAKNLREFVRDDGNLPLAQFTQEQAREFRATWELSPRTAGKTIEKLRTFFAFCVENDWIVKNPAKNVKMPEVRPNPTLPFTDVELGKILEGADFRTSVFFRVLLHSGLRIIDAAQLRPEKVVEGKIFLYTQKTGVPVFCPIPPDLSADLQQLQLVGGFYFAVESDKPESIAEYYRVKLAKIASDAKVKNAHPHRYRDTFAVRLLEKAVPLETVSILLGHTDIKTTQRSYAPWVQSLQNNLELAVQRTWAKPKLARVK